MDPPVDFGPKTLFGSQICGACPGRARWVLLVVLAASSTL